MDPGHAMFSETLKAAARPAKYFVKLEPDELGVKIRCRLCPRECVIREGEMGYCGVRGVLDGELVTFIWGRPSSIAVDPVEKKPLYHFHPGSLVLSLGTIGCNFRCKHCQNWTISMADADSAGFRLLESEPIEPSALVEICRRHGATGVSFTYNEPTIWMEYVLDTFHYFREHTDYYTCLVTNAFISPEPLEDVLQVTDAYRADLKTIRPENLVKMAEYNHPEKVLETIARVAKSGVHLEVVTNIVTNWNDSEEEIREMAEWMADNVPLDTPWHFTRYFPHNEYREDATPVATLRFAERIARERGFKFVYLGNLPGADGDTTCPKCGQTLISRAGYSARILVDEPRCPACGEPLRSLVLPERKN